MQNRSVEQLRDELRNLGYLSHGIEKWFALDPWSSRAFWTELVLLAAKSAMLLAPLMTLPAVAIMLLRNRPVGARETTALIALYGATAFVMLFTVVIVTAFLLKLRPAIGVDSPRILNALALVAAGACALGIAGWWSRFDRPPALLELLVGLAALLLFFVVAVIALAAAFLSFSIHEAHRIPSVPRSSRSTSIFIATIIIFLALLALTTPSESREPRMPPSQVVVSPNDTKIALLAVDGLTWEILSANGELEASFPYRRQIPSSGGSSSPERWASIATGTPPAAHGVHGVDGVRIRGSSHLLQSVSGWDLVLRNLAEATGIAVRQPLPPTARSRDYVWEIVAGRGVPAAAVNWWASESVGSPNLMAISQGEIFRADLRGSNSSPADLAVDIDRKATAAVLAAIEQRRPRLVALFLPALDILLNRLSLEAGEQFPRLVVITEALAGTAAELRSEGYQLILVGTPGDSQTGSAVIASTLELSPGPATLYAVAPTILHLAGFPSSEEMPGRSLLPTPPPERITSYGSRLASREAAPIDREYYEQLRALGYLR
ncbi:MAG TPA: alkaline phosphatase family protein [Thermoanaerobaculia bacterium]|nr:alkaline phosphatase family protein [Thermoanaerobaculia bacterium]